MAYCTYISLILLASVQGSLGSWTLQSNHPNIIPKLTDDVTLNCFYNEKNSSPMVLEYLTRISLLKLDKASGTWKPLADITRSDPTTTSISIQSVSGFQLDGHLGTTSTTFLKVTWPKSTYDTVGSYYCEMHGLKEDNRTEGVIETSVVHIAKKPDTVAHLLEVIAQLNSSSEKLSDKLNEYEELNKTNAIEKAELSLKLKTTSAQYEELLKTNKNITELCLGSSQWPTGKYGLLAPESGCPTSSMIATTVNIETETLKAPNNIFSDFNHFGDMAVMSRSGSINNQKYNLCTYDSSETELLLPKGTYCVHHAIHPGCATGLKYGKALIFPETLKDLKDTRLNRRVNSIKKENGRRHTRMVVLRFCCREDGDPDQPIVLPTSMPFYLYRFRGKCQKVLDMDVTEEWFQIDTDESRYDHYGQYGRPDGKMNDARFELCYYKKIL